MTKTLDIFFINNYNATVISKLGLTFIVKETLNMEDFKQENGNLEEKGKDLKKKGDDLERALEALNPTEMEAVAGGLSRGAKIALRLGGSLVAGALGGAAAGAGIYYATKHNHTSPQSTRKKPWSDDEDAPDLPPRNPKPKHC